MTDTVTVLSMALDSTVPSLILRRLGRVGVGLVWSATGRLPLLGLGRLDLPLAEDRVDAGHLLLHLAQAGVVVELAGGVLEPQVEQLLFGLGQHCEQLAVVHLTELGGGRHRLPPPMVPPSAALSSERS